MTNAGGTAILGCVAIGVAACAADVGQPTSHRTDPDPEALERVSEADGIEGFRLEDSEQLNERASRRQPQLDRGNADGGDVAKVTSALIPPGSFDRRVYAGGIDITQTLSDWNNHVCTMVGFKGPLRCPSGGSCGSFRVGVRSDNTQIEVDKRVGPEATVECVPRTVLTSPGFSPFERPYNYAFRWDSCSSGSFNDSFGGNFATAITGLGYDFNSISDRIWVTQSDSVAVNNQFGTEAIASPCRIVNFFSPIHLRNDGFPARFYGPGGSGQASLAGEYDFSLSNGQTLGDTALAPAQHSCYFTYIAGNLRSANEWANIYGVPPVGAVHLQMSSGSAGSIRVKVRCFPWAQ